MRYLEEEKEQIKKRSDFFLVKPIKIVFAHFTSIGRILDHPLSHDCDGMKSLFTLPSFSHIFQHLFNLFILQKPIFVGVIAVEYIVESFFQFPLIDTPPFLLLGLSNQIGKSISSKRVLLLIYAAVSHQYSDFLKNNIYRNQYRTKLLLNYPINKKLNETNIIEETS